MGDAVETELEHKDDIFTLFETDPRFKKVEVDKKGNIIIARVKFVEDGEKKEEVRAVQLGETNETRFYLYQLPEGPKGKVPDRVFIAVSRKDSQENPVLVFERTFGKISQKLQAGVFFTVNPDVIRTDAENGLQEIAGLLTPILERQGKIHCCNCGSLLRGQLPTPGVIVEQPTAV